VRGFAPDRSTIDVEHEAIPGLMPSMTMPFTPREPKDIASLTLRDAIAFRLAVTDKDALIDNIRKIAANEVQLPSATPPPALTNAKSERLREDDNVPSFILTTEAGENITPASYKGRPWIVTFIFTRCAVPNFCPRMSKNFATIQNMLKDADGPLTETRLLSISFDPEFDTPAVLNQYGQHEGADPNVWNFATGDPAEIARLTKQFAVQTTPEAGTISHGLTTALIGRDGKIVRLWRGNGWTPDEVIAALSASL
jgi:protein SCO1/2